MAKEKVTLTLDAENLAALRSWPDRAASPQPSTQQSRNGLPGSST
ncbi:MAG: hypothetical protein ACR2G7_04900 [Acidimicrobiales bacterium]